MSEFLHQQQHQPSDSHVVAGESAPAQLPTSILALAQAGGGVGQARKPAVTALPRREFADSERRYPTNLHKGTASHTQSLITAAAPSRRPKDPTAVELDRLQSEHDAIRSLCRGGGGEQ